MSLVLYIKKILRYLVLEMKQSLLISFFNKLLLFKIKAVMN